MKTLIVFNHPYAGSFCSAILESVIKGTFKQIGIEDVSWINLSMVKQVGQEQRELWLEDIRKRFARD